MPVEEEEYEAPPSRRQKNLARHKNCLRCEWCNRITAVNPDIWERVYQADRDYIWYCKRPTCADARKDVMSTK